MLSAYIDGRLDAGWREPLEDHLSRCEHCYSVVRETFATLNALEAETEAGGAVVPGIEPAGRSSPPRPRQRWYLAAAAVVLVSVAAFAIWRGASGDRYARAIRPLVEAVGNRRFFEARLTGGFKFGPLLTPRRGADASNASQDWAIVAAASQIRAAAESRSTPERVRALAAAYQLLGEDKDAIRLLEDISESTGDAAALSDLAAAYLSAGNKSEGQDIAKAVDTSQKAIDKDPFMPEAHFNRSLALERLGLRKQAIESWQDFLRLEAQGGWADEAKRHLERLRGSSRLDPAEFEGRARKAIETGNVEAIHRVVESNVSWAWDLWENEFVGDWAESALDAKAERRGLELFATALSERATDASLLPREHPSFVPGVKAYLSGRRLYDRAEWAGAGQELDRMPADLRGTGLWCWAQLYRGILALQRGQASDAERILGDVIEAAERRKWPMLAGRAHWARGVVAGTQGQLDVALRQYALAADHFTRVGAVEHQRFISHLQSEALDLIGDERAAWTARREVLLDIDELRQPRHRFGVYLIGATSAAESGLAAAGQALLREAEDDFTTTGTAADQMQFLLKRAVLTRESPPAATMQLLDRAQSALGTIQDSAAHERFEQELLITEALSLPSGERGRAALDRAISTLTARRAEARLPELLFTRAVRRASAGGWTRAAQDVDDAFAIYGRAAGLDATQRKSYWRQSEIRMPRLVDAVLAEPAPPLAGLLEIERARSLWYHEKSFPLTDLENDVASLLGTLRLGEVGLSFFDGEDRRGVVVLRPGKYEIVRLPGTPREIRRLRDQAATATRERKEERLLSCLDSLRRLLIDPVRESLVGANRLLIVPSADTLGVPFPALWDQTAGRYLVDSAAIESFPSLSAMAVDGSASGTGPGRILFVSGSLSESGAPLPGVAAERDLLRSIYGDRLIADEPPTKAALITSMGSAGLIQFSGHIHSGRKFPGLSWLEPVFADGPAILFAHDVQSARLTPNVVAIVNGCRSAGDSEAHDGGVGFIRPFMLAGAGTVVASVWDVFDDKALQVMADFHRELAAGRTPIGALASVQRAMIRRREPTWAWGGYGVFLRFRPVPAQPSPNS